jgi:hypothetical protein
VPFVDIKRSSQNRGLCMQSFFSISNSFTSKYKNWTEIWIYSNIWLISLNNKISSVGNKWKNSFDVSFVTKSCLIWKVVIVKELIKENVEINGI